MAKGDDGQETHKDSTKEEDSGGDVVGDGDDRGGPTDGDLIIRDGFPALRIPSTDANDGDGNGNDGSKGKFRPMVEGDEPLPRHTFWTCPTALQFPLLQSLLEDCEVVFTARDKPNGSSYSAGQTYFIPASMKPRCALEALALSIFHKHTQHLPKGMYDPKTSGANWWTLVLDDKDNDDDDDKDNTKQGKREDLGQKDEDEGDDDDDDDEVGLHFDADYELEEQTNSNLLLHPRVATVTYLSDCGAPTLILNQKSPPMDDHHKKALEHGIDKAWLSHPKIGKHTAFDGRLLHGAPALYFPSLPRMSTAPTVPDKNVDQCLGDNDQDGDKKPAANSNTEENEQHRDKRQKTSPEEEEGPPSSAPVGSSQKRYTLLVNVWLNHWVMDAALLDDDVVKKMKTPFDSGTDADTSVPPQSSAFHWCIDDDEFANPVPSSLIQTVKLQPAAVNPAGEDEIALCNHNVTVYYNPTMEECHAASCGGDASGPAKAIGSTVQLDLAPGAITLKVGDELEEEDNDDGDGDEQDGDD